MNAPRIHQFVGYMDKVERVQRRATKLCTEIKDLPYEKRLQELKLPSLYYRHERGDMIQVYKILCKKDHVDSERMLLLNRSGRTRGHSMKLEKRLGKLTVRKYSFKHRVTNKWNSLPEWVVCAKTVNEFKDKLDKFWTNRRYIPRPSHACVESSAISVQCEQQEPQA